MFPSSIVPTTIVSCCLMVSIVSPSFDGESRSREQGNSSSSSHPPFNEHSNEGSKVTSTTVSSPSTDSRWLSSGLDNWLPGNWSVTDWNQGNWSTPDTSDYTDWSSHNWTMGGTNVSSYGSNNERNQKMYEPNSNTFHLVQITPMANKPKQVTEFTPVRPGPANPVPTSANASIVATSSDTLTSSGNGTSIQANHPIISASSSSLINPLINIGPPSSSSLLNPLRVFSPLRNLILMSFEGYRRLMTDARKIEDAIRQSLGLSKRAHFRSLDPLDLPEPLILEHRDKKIPILGKVVLTLSDIAISGLSQFKVEQLDGLGRNLYFQHLIPRMDSIANYTIDYHLFDAIPFRVSAGKITAAIPNARVRGTFQVFPDLLNIWFRVAQLNLTTWVEDLNIRFYPEYLISERFAIEKSTIDKIHTAFNYLLPNITDILRLTYTKAIEMRLS